MAENKQSRNASDSSIVENKSEQAEREAEQCQRREINNSANDFNDKLRAYKNEQKASGKSKATGAGADAYGKGGLASAKDLLGELAHGELTKDAGHKRITPQRQAELLAEITRDGYVLGKPKEDPANGACRGTVTYYDAHMNNEHSYSLGMNYEAVDHVRKNFQDRIIDLAAAAARRATDPDGWQTWFNGQVQKVIGIAEGLNEAKEETKAAVAAGCKALTDGSVARFLAKPNAINEPLFKTISNVFDAVSSDPNATNKALEALGSAVVKANNSYSAMSREEQGKVIGKTMFGMINPEGSTQGAEVALKIADKVATNVDEVVVNAAFRSLKTIGEATPAVSREAKQLLYNYLKDTGLSRPELEFAGVPKDYFDDMVRSATRPEDDNVLAMSGKHSDDASPKRFSQGHREIQYNVDSATGRLQRADMGKVREPYNWPAINERFSNDVVRQTTEDSCISAVGEMLSEGRLSEHQFIGELGERPDIVDLKSHLGSEWTSQKRSFRSFADVSDHPWAAELLENASTGLPKSLHSVVIDGVDQSGNLIIRDPWEGTKYEMTPQQFLKVWTGRAVYRPRQPG